MSALTRIRNNQVYNSDIDAATKLKVGSITGALWHDPLTYTGNLTVSNITVNGTTTSLDTINIVSADPIIVLNRNFSGTNTYDVGLVMGRGTQTSTAIIWDETNKEFAFTYTSATTEASYYGSLPNDGYANIHANSAVLFNATITNDIVSNTRISGGTIDSVEIGNINPNIGIFTTANANIINSYGDGVSTGIINGTQFRANVEVVDSSWNGYVFNGDIYSGIVQRADQAGNVSIVAANAEVARFTLESSYFYNPIEVNGNIFSTGNVVTLNGNIIGNDFLFANGVSLTYLWYTNTNVEAYLPINTANVQANNFIITNSGQVIGYISGAIGANTPNTGVFTSVTTTDDGQITGWLTGAIGANTPNTGVFTSVTTTDDGQITGWLTGAIGANTANTGEFTTLKVTSSNESYGWNSGALQVTGGAGFGANVHILGSLFVETNLYVRGPTTTLGSQDLTVNDSIINLHTWPNLEPLTVNDGRDIGLVFHYYEETSGGPTPPSGNGGGDPGDSPSGPAISGDSHAFLGRANDTGYLEWYSRGDETGNIFVGIDYGTFKTGELIVYNSTESSDTITGALRVNGGVGIQGNVYAAAIQNTIIGNGTPAVASFTSLNVYNTATIYENILPNQDDFSNVGSITNQLHAIFVHHVYSDNFSLGNLALIDEDSVLTVRHLLGNLAEFHAAAINNTIIGNNSPNVGTFTNLTSTIRIDGNLYGNLNGSIGTETPNSASFTTIIANGQVTVIDTTITTSPTTGALTVLGGVGIVGDAIIGGNIFANIGNFTGNVSAELIVSNSSLISQTANIGNIIISDNTITSKNDSNLININVPLNDSNVVINSNKVESNLIVHGSSSYENLFVVNGKTGQVGIKQNPSGLYEGSSFQVNSKDSILLPAGTTADRPAADKVQKGMFRYNSSINKTEYWDGTEWNIDANQFTVISVDSFVGNGVDVEFTLSQTSTTAATIVAINGIVQFPISSYVVNNDKITFTEPPFVTDLIDVRIITSTVAVGYLEEGTSSIVISDTDPSFSAVIQGTTRIYANTSTYFNGGISSFPKNVLLTQNIDTMVDQFPTEIFRSAKYVVSVSDFDNNEFQVSDVLVTHNGITASVVMIGNSSTSGTTFFTCNATIDGGACQFNVNSSSLESYCNLQQVYIPV